MIVRNILHFPAIMPLFITLFLGPENYFWSSIFSSFVFKVVLDNMCCVGGRFHNQKQNATYSSSTFNVDNTDWEPFEGDMSKGISRWGRGDTFAFLKHMSAPPPSPLTIKIEIRHKRCKWETPARARRQRNGTNGWFPLQNIKSNRIIKTNSGQNWSFRRFWCIFRFVCRSPSESFWTQ